MSQDVLVALIGVLGTVVGGVITWLVTRRKEKADITGVITEAAMKLIQPLNERIEQLETDVRGLKLLNSRVRAWAERLCCQVRELGGKPVEFEEELEPQGENDARKSHE